MSLAPLFAAAQGDAYLSSFRQTWLLSSNAAGLDAAPFRFANSAELLYCHQEGDYHLMQQPQADSQFRFDTQGAATIGKLRLWGSFAYDNHHSSGSRYNTLLYDPFDENYIYNVADTTLSDFNRQSYAMAFKAAVPLGKSLHLGLSMGYRDRISAKQNDPRSESVSYLVNLAPSLVYSFASHSSLGLALGYAHGLERSVPTLSNSSQMQNVFVLKGLGNFVEDMVGSGGLNTMYYTTDRAEASLQYSLDKSSLHFLTEAFYSLSRTALRQDYSQPRDMGSSGVNDIRLNSYLVLAREKSLHRLALQALWRFTQGTEFSTKQVTGVGWQVVSKAVMSSYNTLKADLRYDCFLTEGDSYRWQFSSALDFGFKDDKYLSPLSEFSYSTLGALVEARRQFAFGSSSLVWLGACAKVSKALDSMYSYSGVRSESRVVQEWYPHDLSIYASDYFRIGADLGYSHTLKEGMSLGLKASAKYLRASSSRSRSVIEAGVFLVF
ncbi:MAG: DUF6850 family outer membrane beta-barrel protein [Candidatus Cryptobacteroides sp.]